MDGWSNDGFDTKRFIEEVHNRPCLWDSTSSDYSDRVLRIQCWEELVDIFKEDDEELTNIEKERIVDALQKRWKSLRGCFTRELQRRHSLSSGAGHGPRKSEYIHFKHLQFLHKVVTTKECDPLAIAADSEEDLQPNRQVAKRQRKIQLQEKPISHRLIEAEKQSVESRDKCECSNQDEDRLFLLSLVNTLRRVPPAKKMATKIKIMSVLDDATSVAPTEHQTTPPAPYILKSENIQE